MECHRRRAEEGAVGTSVQAEASIPHGPLGARMVIPHGPPGAAMGILLGPIAVEA